MSTKFTNQQIESSAAELAKAQRKHRKPRRITKQIRVSVQSHKKLGKESRKRKKTISKVADEVIYEGLRQ